MDRHISPEVRLEFMRPDQLEKRAKAFPVIYIPMGPIEWHSFHLPFGVDALKAHGVLCRAAEISGGVVYPPMHMHSAWDFDHIVPVLTRFFTRLKKRGFRVIYAVSGHNVKGMTDMFNAALEPVIADGTIAAYAGWENGQCGEVGCDHAAKWETSYMMHFYPDLVDLDALGEGEVKTDFSSPWGIGGKDPREFASAELGKEATEKCAQGIGVKARELLASLPEEHRTFGLSEIRSDWGAV